MDADRLGRKALDGFQYGVVLTALVMVGFTPLSLLISGDLVLVKYGLFAVGLVLLLLGSVKARPKQRHMLDPDQDWRPRFSRYLPQDSYAEDGFGGRVHRLLPAAWFVDSQSDRLSDGGRFLFAWLVTWAVSFLMESVFYVGVPTALR